MFCVKPPKSKSALAEAVVVCCCGAAATVPKSPKSAPKSKLSVALGGTFSWDAAKLRSPCKQFEKTSWKCDFVIRW